MLSVVNEDGTTESGTSLIDEIVREGARWMLAAALEAEVEEYIAVLADRRDERGRRLVVRNGRHRPRTVATAAGPVEVAAPRVNDRRVDAETGERERFSSKILAPWCRKSPKASEVLPLLYLHSLPSGDFVPALEQFLGSTARTVAASSRPAPMTSAASARLTRENTGSRMCVASQERHLAGADAPPRPRPDPAGSATGPSPTGPAPHRSPDTTTRLPTAAVRQLNLSHLP